MRLGDLTDSIAEGLGQEPIARTSDTTGSAMALLGKLWRRHPSLCRDDWRDLDVDSETLAAAAKDVP